MRGTVGVTVRYAAEPPLLEGYDTTTAIEEVLVDVGVLQDERQVDWERPIIDPSLVDGFEVTVETGAPVLATALGGGGPRNLTVRQILSGLVMFSGTTAASYSSSVR
jgi:hypothetical protein